MRKILLIGFGVALLTVALSVLTASLMAGGASLPTSLRLLTAVASARHMVRVPGGEELAVLYYDSTGGGTFNVIFQLSDDNGATWSAPDTLNAAPYTEMIEPPELAAAPDGDLYAVWDAADGSRGDSTDVWFTRRDAGAGTWSLPAIIADTDYLAAGPRLAVGSDGDLHVVFYDESDTESDIRYLRSADEGANWTPATEVDGSDDFVQRPSITTGPAGGVHIAYEEIIDLAGQGFLSDEVYHLSSTDDGATWSAPAAVSRHSGAQSVFGLAFPMIAVTPDSVVHMVWVDDDGAQRDVYYAQLAPGGVWSLPANLSQTAKLSYFPSLAVDAGGRLHLVYEEGNFADTDKEIHYAWFEDGAWSVPENLSQSASDSWGPSIAPETGRAGFIATWLEVTQPVPARYGIEMRLSADEVWPGDTDRNGLVDAMDIVPIATHLHVTGPSRADAEAESWTIHEVEPWLPLAAAHADANGDGVVDVRDVLAVGLNWARTHEPRGIFSAPSLDTMDHRLHLAAYRELLAGLAPAGDGPARAMAAVLGELIARAEGGGPPSAAAAAAAPHPNPTTGPTTLAWAQELAGPVRLEIHDARGRRVRVVLDEDRAAGLQEARWDGLDDRGRPLSGGIYFARVTGPAGVTSHKIVLLEAR